MPSDAQRIPLSDVTDLIVAGEPLPFRILDAHARLLLGEGKVVSGPAQIDALVERGAWAEHEAVQQVRRQRDKAAGIDPAPLRRATLFDLWEQRIWDLDAAMRKVARQEPAAADIDAVTAPFVALVDREPDIALFLAMRQDDRRFALYPLTHALHTATLCLFAARQMRWPPAGIDVLVRAALTMNVSMLDLQATMAEQHDPPTPRQLAQIRSHPQRSAQMLRDAGVADEAWLALVEDHHEQAGGGGYPRALQEVTEAVHLLRAADVFMAKVSPRALRPPLTAQVAAKQLFQQEKGGPLAGALIKAIGVHPPGSFVQLQCGEIAVVVRRAAPGAALAVASLTDRSGKPVNDTHIRDTADPQFAVAGTPAGPPAIARVLPERVYGMLEA